MSAAPKRARVRVQDILATILYDLRALKEDMAPVVPPFNPDSNNDLREFNFDLDTWIYVFDRLIQRYDEREKQNAQ